MAYKKTGTVTLKDIAAATGFSANTVSRALSDKPDISEETKEIIRKKAEEMLQATKIVHKARLRSLSAGMQRQLNFICNFCVESRVLLLDEPLTNLDLIFRDIIINSLVERAMEDRIIIVATHEIKEFENLFTHICILRGGGLSPLKDAEEIRAEGMSIEEYYRGKAK